MQSLTRRHFFFGSFSLATACSKRTARAAAPPVSIVKAASYSIDLTDTVRRILVDHRVEVKDKNILLKPNLVEFSATAPINTNPLFVASVAEAFHALGARRVAIAEGPGHRRMTLDMAEEAGFFSAIHGFEDRFTDLNLDEVHRVQLREPFSRLKELYLPRTVLDCDLLVSLPKMKTHHWAGATLSMKNLFGVVPGAVYGWPKNILHWSGINECIADLHYVFPRQFCLVDGIEAMEGNGPILGTLKHAGLIVAGAHPPSVDATCCRLMKIDPAKIGYLELVGRRGAWDAGHAKQIGEAIGPLASRFALHPDLEYLRLQA
jgi:uncharacterized protein (DUF362 family)